MGKLLIFFRDPQKKIRGRGPHPGSILLKPTKAAEFNEAEIGVFILAWYGRLSMLRTVRSTIYIHVLPFLIKLLGKLIMRKAVIDNTSVPISSSRNPSHSFAA
jgi:hypothetical protein